MGQTIFKIFKNITYHYKDMLKKCKQNNAQAIRDKNIELYGLC